MKSILFTLVFVGLVSVGVSMRCYQCNSHLDNDCVDLKSGTMEGYLDDCNKDGDKTNYTLCRKLHMFMDQDFGELHPAEDRVHRDCGTIDSDNIKKRGDCYYKSGYNTRTWVCDCKTDECNAATSMSAGGVVTVLLMPLLVMLLRQ